MTCHVSRTRKEGSCLETMFPYLSEFDTPRHHPLGWIGYVCGQKLTDIHLEALNERRLFSSWCEALSGLLYPDRYWLHHRLSHGRAAFPASVRPTLSFLDTSFFSTSIMFAHFGDFRWSHSSEFNSPIRKYDNQRKFFKVKLASVEGGATGQRKPTASLQGTTFFMVSVTFMCKPEGKLL